MRNIRWIIAIIVVAILCSGLTAYGTYKYYAKDVEYTKKDGTKISVQDVLNEMYNDKDYEFDNKEYTQEGLKIYDNRVTIISGGYYIDSSKMVWVNITYKTNKTLSGNDIWLLIYSFPKMKKDFLILDSNNKYSFNISYQHANQTSAYNRIDWFDHTSKSMQKGEEITLKFKYELGE